MIQVDMSADKRTVFGKGAMRQMRMQKHTPGVVYSGGQEPVALQFATSRLFKDLHHIHGRNAVINLAVNGDSKGVRHARVTDPRPSLAATLRLKEPPPLPARSRILALTRMRLARTRTTWRARRKRRAACCLP